MASTAKGLAGAASASTAGVTEEAKGMWWLRINNGVPAGDSDDNEEEEEEGGERGAAERKAASYSVGGYEVAEMQVGSGGDGTAVETLARGVKTEMVALGGEKAATEAEAGTTGAGGKRRSSSRFVDPAALDEEISGGNYLQPAELPRRKRKVVAKRSRPWAEGTEVQNNISQAQSPPTVVKGPERLYEENENLKLQLALKTTELKQEENRRLQLELILKSKEAESLQKQNQYLKVEIEQLKKNAKPQRVERLCGSCKLYVMHDYRNCPKRREVARSPEEEDGEGYY